MTKNNTIHVRVNETVKINAEQTLNSLGLTLSEAVNLFLCQVNLTGGLPFAVKLPAPASVIAHSKEELEQMLAEAEKDIEDGDLYSPEEVFAEIRRRHGV